MNVSVSKIVTPKTGRVFTSGNTTNPQNIWILLHGYGHAADQFLSFFDTLDNESNLLIAPEGLHRFYTKGFSGRVGASWMTREEREDDIADYVFWLKTVYEQFVIPRKTARVIVLGFSQGGATAARFLEKSGCYADVLVLYAATFPPDVVPSGKLVRYVRNKLMYVWGDQDEFINRQQATEQIESLKNFGMALSVIEFAGKHVIDAAVLKKLETEINAV